MDNIILIGMPGAGKSTIGVLLAKALGYTFLDTDLVIQHREGHLLQDLVDTLGVEGFLEVEADALCSISCTRTVLAPGGSAVCTERGRTHLKSLGQIIYLQVPFEELETRLSNISSRGIAMAPNQTLRELYDYRTALYEGCATATLLVDSKEHLEQTVSRVLDMVKL